LAVGLKILGNSHGLKKHQRGYHANPTNQTIIGIWSLLVFVGVV